jgi:hypothetical protein
MNALPTSPGPVTPEFGMGATICMISDRYGATVTDILSPKIIEVTEDNAKLIEGSSMSEHQVYEHTRVLGGKARRFTLRKNGRWVAEHEPLRHGTRLVLGTRESYRDPSF